MIISGLIAGFYRNLEFDKRQRLKNLLLKALRGPAFSADSQAKTYPVFQSRRHKADNAGGAIITVWIDGAVKVPGFYILKKSARLRL